MHAEEKMKIAHQEDVQRHEEMVMGLVARMEEMVQEDQGSTIRIEQLERQRDLLSNAVGHVNQVHQKVLDDHQRSIGKIEEASHAQHQRDEELATALHHELMQLRSDAAHAFTNVEQQAQGEGQQLAMEYQKLVGELNQKAHDSLQFKMEASQKLSTIAVMKEQMDLLKNEENAMRDEANKRMPYLESGVQELRNTLDHEEFAKSPCYDCDKWKCCMELMVEFRRLPFTVKSVSYVANSSSKNYFKLVVNKHGGRRSKWPDDNNTFHHSSHRVCLCPPRLLTRDGSMYGVRVVRKVFHIL